jgi:hypothetical protein
MVKCFEMEGLLCIGVAKVDLEEPQRRLMEHFVKRELGTSHVAVEAWRSDCLHVSNIVS